MEFLTLTIHFRKPFCIKGCKYLLSPKQIIQITKTNKLIQTAPCWSCLFSVLLYLLIVLHIYMLLFFFRDTNGAPNIKCRWHITPPLSHTWQWPPIKATFLCYLGESLMYLNFWNVCYYFHSATPSIKYSSRNNSGEIVFSFNPSEGDPQHIMEQLIPASHLTVQYATQKDALLNRYKYMFQKQGDKAAGKLLSGFKEIDQFTNFSKRNTRKTQNLTSIWNLALEIPRTEITKIWYGTHNLFVLCQVLISDYVFIPSTLWANW